jgi:hypothetical protein
MLLPKTQLVLLKWRLSVSAPPFFVAGDVWPWLLQLRVLKGLSVALVVDNVPS